MNILEQFAISIDFEHKEIAFFPHGNVDQSERTKAGLKPDAITVPIMSDAGNSRKYTLPLLCNKKPVSLFLDTGAAQSYIYRSASDFAVPVSALKEHISYGIDGEQKSMMASVSLAMENSTVANIQVGFRDGKSDAGDGMLGADFLSHYCVLVDFPARKMYLRPRGAK